MGVYHPDSWILQALYGNETQITRKLNVADIEYKVCETDFVPMWRSRLADSSEEVSYAAAPQGVVEEEEQEEDGFFAGKATLSKYQRPEEEWTATIGFQGRGVIVLDTKVYDDIGDMIQDRDASTGYDPSDDETYLGDVDIMERAFDAVLEIPECARKLVELLA